MCWFGARERQRSLHGLCPERRADRHRLNVSPLTADLDTVRVCVGGSEGGYGQVCIHTHEMRDLTSSAGSDVGGQTVPRTVYAGKINDTLCSRHKLL